MPLDRKSTRLNSSHLVISYAVFCLKKKNETGLPPGWWIPCCASRRASARPLSHAPPRGGPAPRPAGFPPAGMKRRRACRPWPDSYGRASGASVPDWRRERYSAAAVVAARVAAPIAAVPVVGPVGRARPAAGLVVRPVVLAGPVDPADLAGPVDPADLAGPVVLADPAGLVAPAGCGSTAGSDCPWSSLPVAAATARLRGAASPAANAAARFAVVPFSVGRPVPAAASTVVAAFAAPHRSVVAAAVAGWTIATYCSRTDSSRCRARDRRG